MVPNLCQLYVRPLHTPHVTMWCAIGNFCIKGRTVTVTAAWYVQLLHTHLETQLTQLAISDSAGFIDCFEIIVPSLRVLLTWCPVLLPDLTPCCLFLWGHLKANVYCYRP
ncbi:hypothetical protein PR048_021282 [Dryococelus australis]|uniref:Uncharacterized protein n=1 Tax=Dryococelus australis TaxID=614101 RepID=A0ABQ9GXV0_9NEOP|nr:hypothetical protein PR048_021282 [Dryococelus australis]